MSHLHVDFESILCGNRFATISYRDKLKLAEPFTNIEIWEAAKAMHQQKPLD